MISDDLRKSKIRVQYGSLLSSFFSIEFQRIFEKLFITIFIILMIFKIGDFKLLIYRYITFW